MNRVKLVTILFMAAVVLFAWKNVAEYGLLAIWGKPCRIEIENALINANQLVADNAVFEKNTPSGVIQEKRPTSRYFYVENDFCVRVRKDMDVFKAVNKTTLYTIPGRCIPWWPKIAEVQGDSYDLHRALSYAIMATVVVLVFGFSFLAFHRRRLAQKKQLQEEATSEEGDSAGPDANQPEE